MPVVAKMVRSWTGRVRGHLRRLQLTLDSLLTYNVEHPSTPLLTPTQVTAWSQVATDAAGLLAAKKPR